MSFEFQLAEFIAFQDAQACKKVREIKKQDITRHPNPDFHIRVIESPMDFYFAFALDLVSRIKNAALAGKKLNLILPCGPMPQYDMAAKMINALGISCQHVTTFNMDEYCDENGVSAPESWPGSFKSAMFDRFFNVIQEDLRPLAKNIHFPTDKNIAHYGDMMQEAGGIDCCYGGIGWCGHIAFWESHLGKDYVDDLEGYKQLSSRVVTLNPMTIMQNALHSFGADWSNVPPKAVTIGPKEILSSRHRSFWLDGDLGGGITWQAFIARLVMHGPVSPLVPGSLLQTVKTDMTLMGGVAEDVKIVMG